MRRAARVVLTSAEREQLRAWAGTSPPQNRLARRAQIVLDASRGRTNVQVASRLGVHLETVARWRSRFVLNGLEGLWQEAPRAGSGARISAATVRRIVRATLNRRPPDGRAWTTRSLGRSLRVNHMLVHRVWSDRGLGNRRPTAPGAGASPPHVDLGGVFVGPSARVVVFAVDERAGGGLPPAVLPELVPNPTGNPEFSGPRAFSRSLVEAVGRIEDDRTRRRRSSTTDPAVLVFLRGVERSTGRRVRLEAVFDRSVPSLGPRVVRWLDAHPRFRAFTTGRGRRWSESVDAWLRRWETSGFDRGSLRSVDLFVREFASIGRRDRARSDLGRPLSWTSPRPPPAPRSWMTDDRGPPGRSVLLPGRRPATGPPTSSRGLAVRHGGAVRRTEGPGPANA